MPELNRMRGRVRIIGLDDSDLDSSIQLRLSKYLESGLTVRAQAFSDLEAIVMVKYGGLEDVESSIIVMTSSDLPAAIAIRPHNRMRGVVEIIEPPTFTKQYSVIKDAFIRNDIPALNYGSEQDMFVGTGYSGEIYRSLIQFAPLDIPTGKMIRKAEIVLDVMHSGREFPIGLYEIEYGARWEELEVTWEIQPNLNSLVTSFPSGKYYGNKVRIDVTGLVEDWYRDGRQHNGFLLKALDETLTGVYKSYGTKDSASQNPYLEVQYFDPTVFSYGRVHLEGEIDVRHYDDLDGTINVRPTWWEEDLGGDIYVVDPAGRDAEIVITKRNLESDLYVNFTDDLDSSLKVRVRGESNLPAEIVITALGRPGSVYVKHREDLPGEFIVSVGKDRDVPSTIGITRRELEGSIDIRSFSDLEGDITVFGWIHEELEGKMGVTRDNNGGDIYVRPFSDLAGETIVRCSDDSELDADVTITAPEREGSIYVKPYHLTEGEIYVRANGRDDLSAEIFVKSPWFNGDIVVRVAAEDDLESDIYVRANGDDDLDSEIIVRISQDADFNADLTVRQVDHNDLGSEIIARARQASDLPTTIEVHHVSDLESTIAVRVGKNSNFPGDMTVKLTNETDLPADVAVRIRGAADLEGSAFIRLTRNDDLPSGIIVHIKNDLDGIIEVVTEYGYCFIM